MPSVRIRLLSVAVAIALAGGGAALPASAAETAHPAASTVQRASAKKPSALQTWATKKYGTFTAKTYSGTGDAVVTLPKGVRAGLVRSVSHGDANFIAWTLNKHNSVRELVANGLGDYRATMPFGLARASTARQIQVQASGPWTLTVAPIASAGSITGKHANQGVYLYGGRAARLATKNDGESNFIVWQYGSPTGSMHLVVNVYGARSATGPLFRGPSVLDVSAQGDWSTSVR